jgi:hypothetical protein
LTKGNLFGRPAELFALAAACLLVMGIVFFHSSWPPLSFKNIHFRNDDVGKELLLVSALFGTFAFAYFIFPRIFRRQMHIRLGQLHFWVSILAVVAQFALAYYFNLTFHTIPNEPGLDRFFRAFGDAFEADVWAFYILAAAQVVFVVNLFVSIRKRTQIPTFR